MHIPLLACLLLLWGCSPAPSADTISVEAVQHPIGGPCDGCELLFAGLPPLEELRPDVELAPVGERGEPLEIEGRVMRPDGPTPAKDVVLYLYHTDANGYYAPAEGQQQARRHGHLRGWVRTGPDGVFRVRSIRPAPYPGESIPAHIHIFVKEPDKAPYYIDEVRFTDDPLLTAEEQARAEQRGGDLAIGLRKDERGTWHGDLRIILGHNIPHYH